jgi:hypothetical protein
LPVGGETTQTRPKPTATAEAPTIAGRVLVTQPVTGSIRVTVPSVELVTQTAPRPPPAFRHLLGSCLRQLSLAALEGRGRCRLQLGKVVLEPGRDELVEMLRLVEVLELVLTEVSQGDVGDGVVAEQLASGLRDEHLTAVPGRADARRAVDAEADVTLASHGRLARVDAHPHAKLCVVGPHVLRKPALTRDRGRHGVLGPPEGDEERVPCVSISWPPCSAKVSRRIRW